MARYPFKATVNKFMADLEPNVSKLTAYDKRRKLILIAKILDKLVDEGKIKTDNPKKVTTKDIIEYVKFRRASGVSESTLSKDISLLNQLFKFVGNPAVMTFRATAGIYRPHSYTGRKEPLSDGAIEKIYELARNTEDWSVMEGCMIVVFTVSTGIRPQESRIYDIGGISLMGDRSTVYIEKVKGAGDYGKPRVAPIMDGAEDIFRKYLRMRSEKLKKYGLETDAMFPNFRYPEKKYLTQQAFARLKKPVEELIGESFEIRAGRRAFGQRAINNNHDMSDISVAMGHASTKTTEGYYCRTMNSRAVNNMLKRKNTFKEACTEDY